MGIMCSQLTCNLNVLIIDLFPLAELLCQCFPWVNESSLESRTNRLPNACWWHMFADHATDVTNTGHSSAGGPHQKVLPFCSPGFYRTSGSSSVTAVYFLYHAKTTSFVCLFWAHIESDIGQTVFTIGCCIVKLDCTSTTLQCMGHVLGTRKNGPLWCMVFLVKDC